MNSKKVIIGKIINTHGIKGEIKVFPTANNIEDFLDYTYFYIEDSQEKFIIDKSRIHKNTVIIKINNLNNINDVEKYKSKIIYTDLENIRELTEDEYLIMDLIGCEVYEKTNILGKVKDVLQYSANDIIVVERESGKDVLIPNIKKFIKKIDIRSRLIEVELVKGMVE